MSEPNPYESPHEPEPLTKQQVVKRSVAVAAIILLTPPAMVVTVGTTCPAEAYLRIPWQAVWAVPFLVLLGLMVGAAIWDLRTASDRNRSFRIAILLSAPFVVGVATGVGFFLAAAAYATPAMLIAFYAPPALVLLLMLWIAWRAQ